MTPGVCILDHTDRHPDGTRTPRDRPTKTAAGSMLCTGHIRALEQDLAETPSLATDLEAAMQPGSTGGPKISGSPEKKLPVNLDAGTAHALIRDRLASWARMVAEDRELTNPPFTIPATATFLVTHIAWICEQPWVGEFRAEILHARREARKVLSPSHTRRIDLGPCDEPVRCDVIDRTEQPCLGVLQAVVQHGGDEDMPTVITCNECGKVHDSIEWKSLSRRLRGTDEVWVTMAQLSQMLRVEYGTLRRWAHEDKWARLDDGTRRKRYRAGDAQISFEDRRGQGAA